MSQSIFGDIEMVETLGLPMPARKPIAIKSASANVLCTHHNSLLSDLDSEVGKIADGMQHLREGRAAIVEIDGNNIERWFLKMAAGSAAARWAAGGSPPEGIVRQVFGLEPNASIVLAVGLGMERPSDYVGRGIENYRVEGGSDILLTVVNGLPLFFSSGPVPTKSHVVELLSKAGFRWTKITLKTRPNSFAMLNDATGSKMRFKFNW